MVLICFASFVKGNWKLIFAVSDFILTDPGAMANRKKTALLRIINLTNHDLTKDHLRYFISYLGINTLGITLLAKADAALLQENK